ncbi:MAG: HAD hydrolase-like protein, partial [Spirochaetaceae bacterium]|nr:HAD hydrolase-like protein [Spirochaetaceae bacterium]
MKAPFLFFDLDNTLYPPSAGVLQEMNRRIGFFCADYFGIDVVQANEMRRGKHHVYGTTLQWLRVCHGLKDPEPYIQAIHPVNITSFVKPNPALRSFISRISTDYILLTNSPMEHALRTLKALELDDLFPRIWDLRRMGYRGKPYREAYELVLDDLGIKADEALLIDDNEA